MSKIRAAGAVALRRRQGVDEVLLVHRPAYDDWSLPKGKAVPDEQRPCTAVREVREETGVLVQLGKPLTQLRYEVSKGTKTVDYWRAVPTAMFHRPPDREVDAVAWVPVRQASKVLTYADELQLLDEALSHAPTTALLLVRHAKAMLRKNWSGNDQTRRLSGRGRKQSHELIPLLEAYGVSELWSSPATRCVQTLAPYGAYRDVPTETFPILTEEEGTKDMAAVERSVRKLVRRLSEPTALCGHRPVLPAMQAGLGLKERPNVVAEVTVVHRDGAGHNVAVEVHKPTA